MAAWGYYAFVYFIYSLNHKFVLCVSNGHIRRGEFIAILVVSGISNTIPILCGTLRFNFRTGHRFYWYMYIYISYDLICSDEYFEIETDPIALAVRVF